MILVDIDGVLADFVGAAAWLLRGYGAADPKPTAYEFLAEYDDDTRSALWYDLDVNREWAKMTPLEGIDDVYRLSRAHHVQLVTQVPPYADRYFGDRMHWIRRYGLRDVPVTFAHDKQQRAALRGDYLLDDCPANLYAFAATGGTAVCIARPYNADISEGIVRMTLPEAVAWVRDDVEAGHKILGCGQAYCECDPADLFTFDGDPYAGAIERAKSMTVDQARDAMKAAGILDADGNLTARYGGSDDQ